MYVTDNAEIVIDASPEEIWEYVTDPIHWTASNPEEHYGLEYDTPDKPHAVAAFGAGRILGLDAYIEQYEVGGVPLVERYP